jgi:hypothetical protein
MDTAHDPIQWLKGLPDELPIGNINLPGTHNSAAIDPGRRTLHACQNFSIGEQLRAGIRLLDVRLKVRWRPGEAAAGESRTRGLIDFHTCHGRIGRNAFQTFSSLLDECRGFLADHPSEFVVLLLTVDDWSNARRYAGKALAALAALLGRYPTLSGAALPVLGAVRGKIFLYNRLNDDPILGVPVRWANDTAGSAAEYHGERAYEVWVQDRYNDFSLRPRRAKLRWIIAALTKKTPENVVLNFASGTWFGVFGVYVMDGLSQFLQACRPAHFGWILFDYPFGLPGRSRSQPDVVATIIRSNF